MFPRPKSTPIKVESVCGQTYLSPEICDFCNGNKLPAPCRHFCTVSVSTPVEGRVHPMTKALICSLVTCGECQSIDCDDPVNICLKHWKTQQAAIDGLPNIEAGKNDSTTDKDATSLSSSKPKRPDSNNNYVEWETVRDDPTCYIDEKEWITLIQDHGVAISGSRCQKGYRRARNKASRTGESVLQYKDLNVVSTSLYDLYDSKAEYFTINLKRKADGIATIMGWIVDKRDRDIMSFKSITPDAVPRQESFDIIKSWNNMADDDMVYLMDQKSILLEAFGVWGNRAQKVLPNGPNDYVRLIAVMLHPDNRDRTDVINDNIKLRADLDDPSRSKKFVFNEFAQQFSSDEVYSHPKKWDNIADVNLANKQMVNPNDPNSRRKTWSGSEMKLMYDFIIKKYKDAMHKWTKGTGGGSGFPENYEDWESRACEYFENYTGGIEFIPWLTWVYANDQENGSLLLAKYEGLPPGIGTERSSVGSVAPKVVVEKKIIGVMDMLSSTLCDFKKEMSIFYHEGLDKIGQSKHQETVYILNEQFEKAREQYIELTMRLIKSGSDLHPFEVRSLKRKRNDTHLILKKLKTDLNTHGIEKDIEEYPDDDLPC